MEAPTFDYSNIPGPSQAPLGNQPKSEEQPRAVESASASTACQTNSSKFAYILTACALGFITLIALAITVLIFAIVGVGVSSSSGYYDDEAWYYEEMPGYHGYHEDEGDFWYEDATAL